MQKTKLVVCITTFNLEAFISEAIESVLAQITNFDFQILIADDCSTDNTLNILRQYQVKHPSKIIVLESDRNKGSLANSNRLFDGLNSEYFTFLDGDDYWVNNMFLQNAVDFLDTHKEYTIYAGNTQYLVEGKITTEVVSKDLLNSSYSFTDYLCSKVPFIHTSAIVLRNVIFCNGLPMCYKKAVGTFEECALRGEDFRRILHLEKGLCFLTDQVFSVYRIHSKGMWQGSTEIRRKIESAISNNFYYHFFKKKYPAYFYKQNMSSYQNLMRYVLFNNLIIPKYKLQNRDSRLFTEYLHSMHESSCDIQTCKVNHFNMLKKKLFNKLFIKVFCKN